MVTSALQHLLNKAVSGFPGGAGVTVRPPDKARLTPAGNQLNVFLYHTTIDAAWRNQDMPTLRPGETGFPPLPLVLHYVITAYGEADEDDIKAHQLLGRAMSVLHDHPILGPDEFDGLVDKADLENQIERVRITAQTLTVDDMYKLWTAFQTQYRISAAYEVSVVLIDSRQPVRTPLPVLTRGENDSGVLAQAGVDPPFPALKEATPPNRQLAALVGDELTLTGRHLSGASGVRFANPRVDLPAQPTVSTADTEIKVVVPAQLPAGVCTVAALFSQPIVNLTCDPQVLKGQAVFLLLGERQVPLDPGVALPAAGLRFIVADATPETFLVRVRVDGVDSLLVDRRPAVPVFDPSQKVAIA